MKPTHLFRLAFSEIVFHKIQSLLIVGAIALGIFAIFTLNSIGTGIKEEMSKHLQQFGADVAYVFPSSQGMTGVGGYFDSNDVQQMRSITGVERVCPAIVSIERLWDHDGVWITALPDDCFKWLEDKEFYTFHEGGWGAAVGKVIWDEYEVEMNQQFEIKGKKFRVTGLLNGVGNEQDDTSVYLDLKDAEEIYGKNQYYVFFVEFSGEPDAFAEAVKNKFRNRNIQVINFEQFMQQMGGIFNTLNFAVLGVAFISLLVGGITIANTVYSTIKRRTREIGMLKAVGAKDSDVLWLFLFESTILSFLGGVVGVSVGYLTALLVTKLIERFVVFQPSTNPVIVFGSIAVALFIGPIAALVPSKYAAKLQPTEALRYE